MADDKKNRYVDPGWPTSDADDHAVSELAADRTGALSPFGDVTFPLPGGRSLHMDVKFPFDNYVRALEAVTDAERDAFEARFLADVKQRVREITTRSYIDADATVDHVLLFIPNEAIFAFVHEHDPGLLDHAISQKVVICSPSTLFAVLAVVRSGTEGSR